MVGIFFYYLRFLFLSDIAPPKNAINDSNPAYVSVEPVFGNSLPPLITTLSIGSDYTFLLWFQFQFYFEFHL